MQGLGIMEQIRSSAIISKALNMPIENLENYLTLNIDKGLTVKPLSKLEQFQAQNWI
jgi:hypothetical protein